MEPGRILVNEHYLIEQVLACLEKMVDRCESRRTLESAAAHDAILFFRGFVERCYYDKQVTQLLRATRAVGISPEQCLGCSLLQRREEGRFHVDAMAAAAERASGGDVPALRKFTEHARAYIELLLEYIARQEDCLFPMIARKLPESEKTRLSGSLTAACADGAEEGACDTYVDVANRLADHLDVPRAVIGELPGKASPTEGRHA